MITTARPRGLSRWEAKPFGLTAWWTRSRPWGRPILDLLAECFNLLFGKGPRTHTGVTIPFSGPFATPDEAEEAGFPNATTS